jgi:AcrR family transcriptional regulator
MVELAAEVGYDRVTVRHITRLAGVSTGTFYEHFANAEDCFASTYDSIARYAMRRAYRARSAAPSWKLALGAAIRSLVEDIASHPKEGRLVFVESPAAGPHTRSRVKSASSILERLLSDDAFSAPESSVRRHVARGIAAGLARVARTRLMTGRHDEFPAAAGELEEWALSLYGEGLVSFERLPLSCRRDRHGESLDGLAGAIAGALGDDRARILTAAARLSIADGFAALTVPKIRAQAGVSRNAFQASFADVRDCFLEAIETVATSAAARAQLTARRAGSWDGALYATILALCTEAARHPALARLSFVDVFTLGRVGVDRKELMLSLAAERLRYLTPPDSRPTPLLAEASLAAAWTAAQVEVRTSRAAELPRRAAFLTYLTLAPSLGSSAAADAAALHRRLID